MNEFLRDGCRFTQRAVEQIVDPGVRDEESILNLALGSERLLKGLLFELNPTFVYKNPDFKHMVAVLHSERVQKGSEEVARKPEQDVISFRQAVARACAVSPSVLRHKSFYYRLSSQRDIVAHCPLSQLNETTCHNILRRDSYSILTDLANELSLSPRTLFGSKSTGLGTLCAKNQDDVEKRVATRLDVHRRKWEEIEQTPGQREKRAKRTRARIETLGNHPDYVAREIGCPACGESAIVVVELEYDIVDREPVIAGAFVTELRCLYCKLVVSEYDEIDYLNLNAEALQEDA